MHHTVMHFALHWASGGGHYVLCVQPIRSAAGIENISMFPIAFPVSYRKKWGGRRKSRNKPKCVHNKMRQGGYN